MEKEPRYRKPNPDDESEQAQDVDNGQPADPFLPEFAEVGNHADGEERNDEEQLPENVAFIRDGFCRIQSSLGAFKRALNRNDSRPGRYGNDRQTMRNLEIVDIRPEDNIILIKGAVPGSKSALVTINKLKFNKDEA